MEKMNESLQKEFENIQVGDQIKINGRYENLNRESGERMPFVAKKDDVVVVEKILESQLVVRFFEDTVMLRKHHRETYGTFLIEAEHILFA